MDIKLKDVLKSVKDNNANLENRKAQLQEELLLEEDII